MNVNCTKPAGDSRRALFCGRTEVAKAWQKFSWLDFLPLVAHNEWVNERRAEISENVLSFDVSIHIDDLSPEAYVVESIMNRDLVSPEEAIRRALRQRVFLDNTKNHKR